MEILNHPLFVTAVFLFMGGEYLISKKKGLDNFSGYEALSSLVLISLDKIITFFTGNDGGGPVKWLWEHRLLDWQVGPVSTFILTFIAVEFMYYWNHWYNHKVNIGWATHVMHHAPTKYNLTVGFRLGITKFFSLGWMVFLPLIILGFPIKNIGLAIGIIFLYQFFIHTELVPKLGWVDKIFNTPSAHRVHHSNNPDHYNKNLGGVTLVFDHLFGTYHAEGERTSMKYGIPSIMAKKNLWWEITCHWSKVLKQLREATTLGGKVKAVFGSSSQGQKMPKPKDISASEASAS